MIENTFAKLSWKLLEHKVLYYVFNENVITDQEYDDLEVQYLKMCVELQQPNTIVHKTYPGIDYTDIGYGMMEVDKERPSVQLAIKKIINGVPKT